MEPRETRTALYQCVWYQGCARVSGSVLSSGEKKRMCRSSWDKKVLVLWVFATLYERNKREFVVLVHQRTTIWDCTMVASRDWCSLNLVITQSFKAIANARTRTRESGTHHASCVTHYSWCSRSRQMTIRTLFRLGFSSLDPRSYLCRPISPQRRPRQIKNIYMRNYYNHTQPHDLPWHDNHKDDLPTLNVFLKH